MIRDYLSARQYLAPPQDAFWRWSDEGGTLVWSHGGTVAFREELVTVLRRLQSVGLPSFAELVLVLAACRDSWPEGAKSALAAHRLFRRYGRFPLDVVGDVFRGLDRVHALPRELRTAPHARAELVAMIFESMPRLLHAEAPAVLRGLEAGLPAEMLLPRGLARLTTSFAVDLYRLRTGLERVDAEALALRCRTGLEAPLRPAEVDLDPADGPRALLARLESDEELGGLARLARNLMAAVHLPRTLADRDELPVGGLSDLTNRGPLDRLLMSELAHDDTTLMTRIALGEALYLRREAPPHTPPRQRAILIDAGVRTWGVPRVFATAVALAMAASADARRIGNPSCGRTDVRVWRADGGEVVPVNLSRREGLLTHLEALAPDPHPGEALPAFLSAAARAEGAANAGHGTDLVVLTTAESLDDHEFVESLAAPPSPLFIGTVTRDGQFRLLARTGRGMKLIREARLNLDELLAPPRPSALPLLDERRDASLPAILFVRPFPLRLPHALEVERAWPAAAGRIANPSAPEAGPVQALALTRDRRLMYWDRPRCGARQLDDRAPAGRLHWCDPVAENGIAQAVVGDVQHKRLWLVTVDLNAGRCRYDALDLDAAEPRPEGPIADAGLPLGVCAHGGVLFVLFKRHVAVLERAQGRVLRWQALPAGVEWRGGRFLKDKTGWFALSFDGTTARLQPVVEETTHDGPPLIGLFERPGIEGPIGVTSAGNLYLTATNSVQCFVSAHGPDSTRRFRMLAVGRDARRVVIAPEPPMRSTSKNGNSDATGSGLLARLDPTMWVLDLDGGGAWPMIGNPQSQANPWLWSVARPRNIRHRFASIGVTHDGSLTLVSSRGRRWKLALDPAHNTLLFRRTDRTLAGIRLVAVERRDGVDVCERVDKAPRDRLHVPFVDVSAPPGTGYRLRAARWNDGSRAFLDSRGLLHLKSADPGVPELTLVLIDGEVAGWSSDGRLWGPEYYTGDEANASTGDVYRSVLARFVALLR